MIQIRNLNIKIFVKEMKMKSYMEEKITEKEKNILEKENDCLKSKIKHEQLM